MKVKEVIIEYHKLVPFPWTLRKIRKAGYDPTILLIEVGRKLGQCENADTDAGKELLDTIHQLELLG